MHEKRDGDTRARLIAAAAELVAAAPGEDFSLRAACDAAGVTMPTAYHFFGSKQGLIDALVERGFEQYLTAKQATESTGDPIGDIRAGWDAHVTFGLAHPGLYTLMYGQVRPGYAPASHAAPTRHLAELTARAAAQGRLAVTPQAAAAHVLATNVGVTLRQIVLEAPDPDLSAAVRDATLAAITGAHRDQDPFSAAIEAASAAPDTLGAEETRLLIAWLGRLRDRTSR